MHILLLLFYLIPMQRKWVYSNSMYTKALASLFSVSMHNPLFLPRYLLCNIKLILSLLNVVFLEDHGRVKKLVFLANTSKPFGLQMCLQTIRGTYIKFYIKEIPVFIRIYVCIIQIYHIYEIKLYCYLYPQQKKKN